MRGMSSLYSVSLNTDPLQASHNPVTFSVPPGNEKPKESTQQTKSPDNSNILHMLNNNTFLNINTLNITSSEIFLRGGYF